MFAVFRSVILVLSIVVLRTISSIVEGVSGIYPASLSLQYRYVKKGVSGSVSTLSESASIVLGGDHSGEPKVTCVCVNTTCLFIIVFVHATFS